ncbi:hypothetical protein O3G_MSEX001089, partial [Manduca sexta]
SDQSFLTRNASTYLDLNQRNSGNVMSTSRAQHGSLDLGNRVIHYTVKVNKPGKWCATRKMGVVLMY